jgi:hypothetical protein
MRFVLEEKPICGFFYERTNALREIFVFDIFAVSSFFCEILSFREEDSSSFE